MYIEHDVYHVPYHVIITTKMTKWEALLPLVKINIIPSLDDDLGQHFLMFYQCQNFRKSLSANLLSVKCHTVTMSRW